MYDTAKENFWNDMHGKSTDLTLIEFTVELDMCGKYHWAGVLQFTEPDPICLTRYQSEPTTEWMPMYVG